MQDDTTHDAVRIYPAIIIDLFRSFKYNYSRNGEKKKKVYNFGMQSAISLGNTAIWKGKCCFAVS